MPAAASAKTWFKFENASHGVCIDIMDEIGAYGVSAKDFRQQFNRIGKKETVNLHINSSGGSITDGNEIVNLLKAHKGMVNVTVGALAASMATAIAVQGDSVKIAKNGWFMIHNPFVLAMGDSDELRKMAKVMDGMKANLVADYAKKTGKSGEEISAMMDEETWMDAEEAVSQGFADEIMDPDEDEEDEEAAAHFDLSKFKNSAKYLSKHKPNATGEPVAPSGNAPAQIQVAAAKPEPQPQPTIKNSITMTPEEIAAQKVATEKAIQDGIKAAISARTARDKEIKAAVALIAKRDKRDVSDLAEQVMSTEGATVADFYAAYSKADNLKPLSVSGSGIEEVNEPLDALKGTIGFQFVNSAQGRDLLERWKNGRHNFSLSIQIPNFFNTQTSTSPNTLTKIEYQPGIAMAPVRKLRIKDLIAPGATNATTIRYRQENLYQNDAAAVAETGTLANMLVTVQEVDAPVRDIGGYIEESENLLADYMEVASLINVRIPYNVERKVEDELLNGSGGAPHITGILATSGVQTQAKSTDTASDAIHKAITNVRTVPNAIFANGGGGWEPDGIVIHPTDWQNLRLSKDDNLQYYGGGPFTSAYGNAGGYVSTDVFWGLPVVITTAISSGTALVGAFRECSQYYQRQGLTIEMTNSNGTNFVNRIVTVRAAERLALAVRLPNGFCQVTGL